MAPSTSERHGLSLFLLPKSLPRMWKECSNFPRPETAPPLGFQKQRASPPPLPFGLSSGSCSSLGCFHFLHSTRHPEKTTHIHIRIFSVSQNLRKVSYPCTEAQLWSSQPVSTREAWRIPSILPPFVRLRSLPQAHFTNAD